MEAISYKLPVFEGPLDLLLQLIQRNKLNIYDISITELLSQYMDTIRVMRENDPDIASEFLTMAARLVEIKSAMLLPRHEEATELERVLTGELIEYRLCQQTAANLARQYIGGDVFVRDPGEVEPDLTYRRQHPPRVLLDAYIAAAGRGQRRLPPDAATFSGIVSKRVVSVFSKSIFVLRRLKKQTSLRCLELYESALDRQEMVAILLALLELVKEKRVFIDGDGDRQQVRLLSPEEQALFRQEDAEARREDEPDHKEDDHDHGE